MKLKDLTNPEARLSAELALMNIAAHHEISRVTRDGDSIKTIIENFKALKKALEEE